MNWYKCSKKDLDFSSPEELLKWMENNIDYSWMDSDYEEHNDFGEYFWDNYSMLLPEEVIKHKIGICWDQTIFENFIFDNYFPNYDHRMIFIQQYKATTHTFLIFKKNDEWYYFEHSYNKFKGIHGPFDTPIDIVDYVKDNMESDEEGEGFQWTYMDPEDFKEKLTCKEFMDACDYNYERMEKENNKS